MSKQDECYFVAITNGGGDKQITMGKTLGKYRKEEFAWQDRAKLAQRAGQPI